MKSRKEIIIETITDFVRGTVPQGQKQYFDARTAELQRADRGLITPDLSGLPLSTAKKLVGNLRKSGRLERPRKPKR
jgi:hypothetical protein